MTLPLTGVKINDLSRIYFLDNHYAWEEIIDDLYLLFFYPYLNLGYFAVMPIGSM